MARALSANGGRAGMFHAPRTRRGLWFRNTALRIPAIQRWMIEQASQMGDDIELPDYAGLGTMMEAA